MNPPLISNDERRKGFWYALGCYGLWGLFPLYWYPLNQSGIGADQLLAWRIVFSSFTALALLYLSGQQHALKAALNQPKIWLLFTLSSLCISINWLVYLWAMMTNHVLDASLGYFMSPLFNILIGRLALNERLNRLQTTAIALAAVGILWLALPAGNIPWVALSLSSSFAIYGLIRKLAPLGALPGLVLETLLMLPLAAGYLLYLQQQNTLVTSGLSLLQTALLAGSGLATAVPLLLFAAAARRIPLSTLGMIQYSSPTLQMLLGLLLFHEVFNLQRFIGYGWVWLGVALYLFAIWHQRKTDSA